MAYPSANAHAADEPGRLAPALREMNTFILFKNAEASATAAAAGDGDDDGPATCVPVSDAPRPADGGEGDVRQNTDGRARCRGWGLRRLVDGHDVARLLS